MARGLSAQEAIVVAKPKYSVYTRVFVKDAAGNFVDYSTLEGINWILDVEYGSDIDQQVADATVTLRLDTGALSLAPLVQASKINNPAGSYAARIESGREMYIETATIPLGSTPAAGDWREVFRGDTDVVDDPCDSTEGTLKFTARDLGGRLQDRYLRDDGRAGGGAYAPTIAVAVETVMQQILDDWGPGGVTLLVPVSPGWALIGGGGHSAGGYRPGKTSVLEALNQLATMIGWVVRYKWDGTSLWRLTFYEPDRAKSSPDHTLTPSQILKFDRVERSLAEVRNRIRVTWYADPGDNTPQSVTEASDATSIAAYGERFAEIDEGKTSAINTSTEAGKLAAAALSDLKALKVSWAPVLLYRYNIDVEDLVRLSGPTRAFDTNQDVGVTSLRHKITGSNARTTIAARGAGVAGGHAAWFLKLPRDPWLQVTVPVDAPTHTATSMIRGAILDAPNVPTRSSRFSGVEFHVSITNGFTPSSATLKQFSYATRCEVTGLTPGTTYYSKTIVVRKGGVKSAASAQVSFVAGFVGLTDIDPAAGFLVPNAEIFGDGSDGTATFDGSATPAGSTKVSATLYTITRDVQYTNMTVSTGVVVQHGPNYRIFVNGTLTLNGTCWIKAMYAEPGTATSDTGGNGGAAAVGPGASGARGGFMFAARTDYTGTLNGASVRGILGFGQSGASGNIGSTSGGGAKTTETLIRPIGSLGGDSGTGGTGGTGGVAGDTANAPSGGAKARGRFTTARQLIDLFANDTLDNVTGGAGGAGGGGGGGNAAAVAHGGAGGGGGGAGGGVLLLAAYAIVLSSWTNVISADGAPGGTGGNGITGSNAGCGGGGGGGGGGFVAIVYHSLSGGTFTASPATYRGASVGGANVTANGGGGGNKGNTNTTGATNGTAGGNGYVVILQV